MSQTSNLRKQQHGVLFGEGGVEPYRTNIMTQGPERETNRSRHQHQPQNNDQVTVTSGATMMKVVLLTSFLVSLQSTNPKGVRKESVTKNQPSVARISLVVKPRIGKGGALLTPRKAPDFKGSVRQVRRVNVQSNHQSQVYLPLKRDQTFGGWAVGVLALFVSLFPEP